VFGCFAGGALAAAGMLEPWGARLLHVGIATHPGHRGRGYGKAVVSAMTAHGLATGRVVQYRTLLANLPSVGIARALGFQRFALTLAVRLHPP
jgi:predicted GNAT family acetyltransferase